MSRSIIIPPIKSQGIKTKLIPWINDLILCSGVNLDANWIEPFFGTGIVGFNSPMRGKHIVGDTNPHIIAFYKGIQDGRITSYSMRKYLNTEGHLLENSLEDGYVYFREVRDRFNRVQDPYDFLFLSRASFNGMMRFNRKGEWNVPFCKRPERFAPAYITKICNQIDRVSHVIRKKEWIFSNISFVDTIKKATASDIIYCDPPYFGRHVDYYNNWTEQNEKELFDALVQTPAKFILSTWHHNDYRKNEMVDRYWKSFNITTKDHFYHNGGKIENRHSVVEALVFNFDIQKRIESESVYQMNLLT